MFKYIILLCLVVSAVSAADNFSVEYSELFADTQQEKDKVNLTKYAYFVKLGEREADEELLLEYDAPENSLGAEITDFSPEERAELEEDKILLLEQMESEAIKADEAEAESKAAVADDKAAEKAEEEDAASISRFKARKIEEKLLSDYTKAYAGVSEEEFSSLADYRAAEEEIKKEEAEAVADYTAADKEVNASE